jgi:hypothetical protein
MVYININMKQEKWLSYLTMYKLIYNIMSQVLLSLNTAIDIYYHITGSIVNAASYKK